MYISGIDWQSITDGDGVRTTLFASGCKHNCLGCHNPDTHSFTNGTIFNEEVYEKIVDYITFTPYIKGITLSGGDPMFSAEEIIPFIKKIKDELPYIDIWCYTGFTFENLLTDRYKLELLKMIDVLVDSKFEIDKRDITLKFRGSSNQRVIDVKKSLEQNEIVLYLE
jgi:anaerobic ribonucleoside-triphosphate reductase activating protein